MTKRTSRLPSAAGAVFNKLFFGVFLLLFLTILLYSNASLSYFGELGDLQAPWYLTALRYVFLTFCFALAGFAVILLYRLINREGYSRLDDKRFNTAVILIGVFIILLIQLGSAYVFRMRPVTDVGIVEEYAKKIAQDGSFDCIANGFKNFYIVKYQNNLAYLFILSAVYRLAYIITGELSQAPVIVLNTVFINIAVLFTVLTSRRAFGSRKAVFTLALCALFTPYYTYAAYYYTDSFSIPCVAGAVYFFVCALQNESRAKKIIMLILCGAFICAGFEIKGSAAILIPAIIIYLLIERGIKRTLKTVAPIALGFVILFTSYTAAVRISNVIPKELSDRYQFPLTHWMMIGLGDAGAYTKEDSLYTESFPSKEEKTAANLEEIGRRIDEKGFGGMVRHIGLKATWSWMDGTYYVGYYLADCEQHTVLHDFVLYDGQYRFIYYALSSGLQLLLLLMMAYSAWKAGRERKTEITTFFRIAVFGLFLFLLIWETNSRYPFNFSPLYLLIATEAAGLISARIKRRRNKDNLRHAKE